MEALLALFSIVEPLLWVILEILYWLPWELFISSRERKRPLQLGPFIIILSALAGTVVGSVSIHVLPEAFLNHRWTRIGNLVLSPLGAWYVASLIFRSRERRGIHTNGPLHGVCAAAFTFALAAVRYVSM